MFRKLMIGALMLVALIAQVVANEQNSEFCKPCEELGSNSYPVLNEVQISADGKYALIEIISCSNDSKVLSIPMRNGLGQRAPLYAEYSINRGINVLPSIDVWEDRLINIELVSTFDAVIIGRVVVPTPPSDNVSYQRIPDVVGPFVWLSPTFGRLNSVA